VFAVSRESLRAALGAVAAFMLALAAYGGTAWVFRHFKTEQVYFDHLADAFRQGRLHLEDPPGHHDLVPYQDRWYVPFPPMPALLMLPFVYIRGRESIDPIAMSICLGAGSVALLWAALRALARRGWIDLNWLGSAAIVAFFAFGTAHWYVAVTGSVWFLSQTCTVFFLALAAFLAIVTPRPLLPGAALAAAMLARPNVLLMWPLLAGIAAMRDRASATDSERLDPEFKFQISKAFRRWCILSLVPPLLSAFVLGAYNYARFDHPLDFGYKRQQIETSLMEPLHAHGQFSLDHVPRNLWYLFVEWPRSSRREPRILPSDMGMSIVLTSPAWLWLITLRRRDSLALGAAAAALFTLIPLLCYYNTGWKQFGNRFLLDLAVPLTILLAISARRRLHPLLALLVGLSIAVHAWGVWWWFTEVTLPLLY
jgi:hypothetical protein